MESGITQENIIVTELDTLQLCAIFKGSDIFVHFGDEYKEEYAGELKEFKFGYLRSPVPMY